MKKVSLVLAIVLAAVFVAQSQTNGCQAKKSQLDGTWELVAGQQLPKGAREIKIISGGHFIFAAYDTGKGELLWTGGGTYVLNGSSYTEHVDFGDRISAGVVGKDQQFGVKIDGDTFVQAGTLSNGKSLSETWKRVNCAYAQVSTWKIDPAHSSVNFEISHLAVSHIHGSLTKVSGVVELNDTDLTKSSVEATIDTTTVSTGVVMRDNTLKSDNFFNVQKYPQIMFKSSSLRRNNGTVQLLGDLTLNGVTRSVTLDLDGPSVPQTIDGKTISGFSATCLIRRSDFSFGPSKFNAVVGDDVKLMIDIEIDKQ